MERIVKTFCGVCERSCGMQVTAKNNEVMKIEGLTFFEAGVIYVLKEELPCIS